MTCRKITRHSRHRREQRKGAMDRQGELSIIRAAYAKQILAAALVVDNARLEAALSETRREDFLGAGPWFIRRFRDFRTTPDADPVYLYIDDLVAIVPERQINNGQPSLHAHLMHQASPAVGEHVVHIGTGTGYYTAILAHLVGPSGRVTDIEYESELAARAKTNFAAYQNVDIVEGDGALVSFDTADVIYVNAGCTRPAENWLDRVTCRSERNVRLGSQNEPASAGEGRVAVGFVPSRRSPC
jgi:protein-L-isoaspartate(D-aspartate) O-methyltransferase